jgi:3-dehydroquinate synthase
MKKVISNGCEIHIGSLPDTSFSKLLKVMEKTVGKIFVLVDENTLKHCWPKLQAQVPEVAAAELIEIDSGEENKNIEMCTQIWQVLSEMEAGRDALLINLGGGVIGDMGGFIASLYKRGIRFINVPTTLLAQVDASVGGKTGVDLNLLKNQVGVINHPEAVFIDSGFLRTLSKRQMLSGFAEVIKHGLIKDANYWNMIRKTDISQIENLDQLIHHSVRIKDSVVSEDPYETGVRKILNFGHTVGHAVETYSLESEMKSLLHGEAIIIGMICEAWLSHKKLNMPIEQVEEITSFVLPLYPIFQFNEMAYHRFIELMRNDKKNMQGNMNFTLLKTIGEAVYNKECSAEDIIDSLDYYRSLTKTAVQ